jgi:hypothetical protein
MPFSRSHAFEPGEIGSSVELKEQSDRWPYAAAARRLAGFERGKADFMDSATDANAGRALTGAVDVENCPGAEAPKAKDVGDGVGLRGVQVCRRSRARESFFSFPTSGPRPRLNAAGDFSLRHAIMLPWVGRRPAPPAVRADGATPWRSCR